VRALAERYIAEGRAASDIRPLAQLADALGVGTSELAVYVHTPTPTFTPWPTNTPMSTETSALFLAATSVLQPSAPELTPAWAPPTATPSPSPTPEPEAAFRVQERQPVCEAGGGGWIRVYVRDAEGRGLSGVAVRVTWSDGEDVFFTGLRPDVDPGYADFQMQPGVIYAVAVADRIGEVATGLSTETGEPCPNPPASWHIVFQIKP